MLMPTTNDAPPAVPTRLPPPREPVSIRPATADDLPFIDALQKRHAKQVGWMPRQQLEGKIAAGQVVVAEGMQNDECRMQNGEPADGQHPSASAFCVHHSAFCIP